VNKFPRKSETSALLRRSALIISCGVLSSCLTAQEKSAAPSPAPVQQGMGNSPNPIEDGDMAAKIRDARPRIVTYDGITDDSLHPSTGSGILESELRAAGLELEPLPEHAAGGPWLP
jgi:hypothetical protein